MASTAVNIEAQVATTDTGIKAGDPLSFGCGTIAYACEDVPPGGILTLICIDGNWEHIAAEPSDDPIIVESK